MWKRSGEEIVSNVFGWACVVILESLIPVMVIGNSHSLVTSSVKEEKIKAAERGKPQRKRLRAIVALRRRRATATQ